MNNDQCIKGFSLVEIAIVLVILGLVASGIISGQALIRSAEIKKFQGELDKNKIAVNVFRQKYNALPGDMPNATKFWGISAGDGYDTACFSSVQTDQATCNGNGNGVIESVFPSGSSQPYSESQRVWQHLHNAGLITEKLLGGDDDNQWNIISLKREYNILTSALSSGDNSGWHIWNVDPLNMVTSDYSKHNYIYALFIPLSTEEIFLIDTKFDDGKPFKGKLNLWKPISPACAVDSSGTSPSTDNEADYHLDYHNRNCILSWKF